MTPEAAVCLGLAKAESKQFFKLYKSQENWEMVSTVFVVTEIQMCFQFILETWSR